MTSSTIVLRLSAASFKRQYLKSRNISRLLSSNVPATSSNENSSLAPTKTNESTSALTTPIDFNTSSAIAGEESQILQVHLKRNQILRAESGAMLFMTDGVEMSTSMGGKDEASSASALKNGLKRMLTGQNMMLSDYSYHGKEGTEGTLALGTAFPSKILRFSLKDYGGKLVCQNGAYLASSMGVDIEIEFTKKLTAGFFGGEGFILQALMGDGDVFIKAGGTLVKKELDEGETLRVSSGSLVAFTQDVEFDVQTMPGFKNVMFGGQGLFVTTLTGPGTVWLQGMSPDKMISEIARRLPSGGIGLGIPIGMGGGGGTGEGTEGVEGEGADLGADANSSEDLVAATDQAVQADRNATVAASGFGSPTDSESASSLFGDAAPKEDASFESAGQNAQSSDTFGGPFDESSTMPDMDDSNSFSTESTDFGEDLTKDGQFDDFTEDETSFTVDDGISSSPDAGEEGRGLLGTLWDLFNND
jgi:uncharacterized protein (TIGR00266 family)